MNQTQNYQLNQWEMTDLIKMEDFNGDNSKVDAALKTLAGQVASKANSSTVSSLSAVVNAKAAQSDLTAAVNRVTALESGKADKTALAAEQTARENADNAEKAARETADTALRSENCWVKLGEWSLTNDAAVFRVPVANAGAYRELRLFFENHTAISSHVYLLLNELSDGNYGSVNTTASNGDIAQSRIELDWRGGTLSAGSISFFPMGSGCTGYSCEGSIREYNSVWSIHHVGLHKALDFSALTSLKIFTTSNSLLAGTSFALYGLKN